MTAVRDRSRDRSHSDCTSTWVYCNIPSEDTPRAAYLFRPRYSKWLSQGTAALSFLKKLRLWTRSLRSTKSVGSDALPCGKSTKLALLASKRRGVANVRASTWITSSVLTSAHPKISSSTLLSAFWAEAHITMTGRDVAESLVQSRQIERCRDRVGRSGARVPWSAKMADFAAIFWMSGDMGACGSMDGIAWRPYAMDASECLCGYLAQLPHVGNVYRRVARLARTSTPQKQTRTTNHTYRYSVYGVAPAHRRVYGVAPAHRRVCRVGYNGPLKASRFHVPRKPPPGPTELSSSAGAWAAMRGAARSVSPVDAADQGRCLQKLACPLVDQPSKEVSPASW
eukprot:2601441-Prymnesium_polylepis.1